MSSEEAGVILPFPNLPRARIHVTLWESRRRPVEAELEAELSSAGYQVLRWASEPYQRYLAHAHIYTEVMWIVAGSMTVVLPEEKRILDLNPGDRIEVPAGMHHASQAGPEGALYLIATR